MHKPAVLLTVMILLTMLPLVRAQDGGDDPFGPSRRILTHIEAVEIEVVDGSPRHLTLNIVGENRDGCDLPVQVRQIRFRQRVWVRIYRIQAAGMMCPAVLMPYEDSIPLIGGLDAGTGVYQIDVNGVTVDFES